MANRMISYGYGIENGKITVIPSEAEIVREIFNAYLSGKILKEIAIDLSGRGIVFFEGKSNWNKNTVVRIIQNEKYIGEKNYPAIIDREIFEKANSQKDAKGHKKEKQPEIIEYLKGIAYCGECGDLLHRRVTWGIREKWYCESGCKCEKYIDDKFIFDGVMRVLSAVRDNSQLLYANEEKPTYTKTQEIMRQTNEIGRYMNERTPSFNAGKKLILECAALKFSACGYSGKSAVAEYIVERLKNEKDYLKKDFLQKIIERIIVKADGGIAVRFIGGMEVTENDLGGANASAS